MIGKLWAHKLFFIGGLFGFLAGLYASRFLYSIIFLIVIGIMLVPAYAYPESLGIQLSNSCLTMIRHNITTVCPTYEEILVIFPDTSNQRISGAFGYSDDGVYERQPTKFKKHYNFYEFETEKILWIDPPGDLRFRSTVKMITIEPSLPEYKTLQRSIDEQVLEIGHGRWNDTQCKNITMGAEDWLFLLGDTLQYVNNKCNPAYTNFDNTKELYFKGQEYDNTTSYKYKLDKYIAEAKERCKTLCFEY